MLLTAVVYTAAILQNGKKPSPKPPAPKLKVEVIAPGTGEPAAPGDLITVDYTGKLASGKVFDSSIPIKPSTGHFPIAFHLGAKEMIPGFDQGLAGAKLGSKLKITIPPALGYGSKDVGNGVIPANSTLIFEAHVLAILKKGTKQVIEIKELAPGDGPVVKDGDTVSIHYTGTFLNGQKFDSSRDRNQPFSFKVGAKMVVPGFDLAVLGMKKGGQRKVTIPPELAYGERGAPGAIPPNSTLIFDIEIVDVK